MYSILKNPNHYLCPVSKILLLVIQDKCGKQYSYSFHLFVHLLVLSSGRSLSGALAQVGRRQDDDSLVGRIPHRLENRAVEYPQHRARNIETPCEVVSFPIFSLFIFSGHLFGLCRCVSVVIYFSFEYGSR